MADWSALNASVMEGFAEPVPVIYRPRGGQPPLRVSGVFDRFHVQVQVDGGTPVSTRRASLGVQQADFPPGFVHAPGDRVQVAERDGAPAATYDVVDPQPDGMGWVNLALGMVGEVAP